VCGDGAISQQGNPVVQEVISGREGSVRMHRKGRGRETVSTRSRGELAPSLLEQSLRLEKWTASPSPLSLPSWCLAKTPYMALNGSYQGLLSPRDTNPT